MYQETSLAITFYKYLFTDLADPRTNPWFLISDPVLPLAILILYLYFVLSWGPRFMRNRPPYELKTILVVYNFLQVLLSAWLFLEAVDILSSINFNWNCEPVDSSTSPTALRIIRGVYIYFLAKMTELLDTVFFVLRKNNRQITFLHVYHHMAMPMISWGATKYFPGGHGAVVGIINSFVHIFMYTYYMIAVLGPKYRRFLWWKKYLTTLQMVQFGLAFLHNSQLLFVDCGYPRWSVVFTLPNALFFYVLFSHFYQEAYSKKKKIPSGGKKRLLLKERNKTELETNEISASTGGLEIGELYDDEKIQ